MIYYKAIQDIPEFQLKKGDELKPGGKNQLSFEHSNGLSMPQPLVENMVQNGLFEKLEDSVKPKGKAPKIPKIATETSQLSLEDELQQTITEFLNNKDQGSNLIVNSPIGDYLQSYLNIKDAGQSKKENGLYHIGSIKTPSQYDINVYVDPYIDWGQMDSKIYSGDFMLDLGKYYELFKKEDDE